MSAEKERENSASFFMQKWNGCLPLVPYDRNTSVWDKTRTHTKGKEEKEEEENWGCHCQLPPLLLYTMYTDGWKRRGAASKRRRRRRSTAQQQQQQLLCFKQSSACKSQLQTKPRQKIRVCLPFPSLPFSWLLINTTRAAAAAPVMWRERAMPGRKKEHGTTHLVPGTTSVNIDCELHVGNLSLTHSLSPSTLSARATQKTALKNRTEPKRAVCLLLLAGGGGSKKGKQRRPQPLPPATTAAVLQKQPSG